MLGHAQYLWVNGGDGNDTITNSNNLLTASSMTIEGGKGNDLISIPANNTGYAIIYKNGDGNDTIYGLSNDDYVYHIYRLSIEGAKYTSVKSGDDIKVNVGNGSILLKDAAKENAMVYGIEGTLSISGEYIDNSKSNTVINGTSKDDSITSTGSNVTIIGGNGNDTIDVHTEYIYTGTGTNMGVSVKPVSNVSINSGAGNDFIDIYDMNSTGSSLKSVTVDAGAGNDTVANRVNNVTINSGDGNDSIDNHDAIVTIDGGAGNDLIISDSAYCSISGGDGNDTIKNSGISFELIMDGGAGDDLIENLTGYNSEIRGGQGKDSIYNSTYNVTINGGAGNDLISVASEGSNNLIQYANGDGNDTIYGFNADDTLQITGSKYSTVKSGKDLKVSVGSGSILLKDAANISVNIEGTLAAETTPEDTTPADTLPVGISIKNSVLTASAKFTGKSINAADYEDVKTINAAAISQAVTIFGSDSDDSIKGGKGADTINGGKGNDTLAGGAGKDIFVYAGGNDLITDYKPSEDKIQLNLADVTKTSVKSSDVILTTAQGTISIKGAKDKVVTFTDDSGATTDLIFYSNISYAPLETGLSYDAKRTVLTASTKFKGTEIDLSEYLSSVTKLNASALSKNISIVGTADNNSLKGGKGADTIFGGIGKNTLTGGAGKDIFVYNGGNDLITDYKVGEDKIQINFADVKKSSVKGSDVILTTADGTISIKGAKDKVLTFTDDSGATTDLIFYNNISYAPLETGLSYDAKRTVLTASTKFTGTKIDLSDYLSSVTKVNAAALSKNVSIIGTAANNSIKGGKGADTIFGGIGKNTLAGGNGADIFIYSSGKDVITDYKAGEDSIKINGTITQTSYSGKDVVFTVGSGTLTVQKAKDKEISVTDSSGTKTYSKTLDLMYDDNFVTDEFEIDEITEEKVDVTEIQTAKTETFAQDENILTFTDDK